MKDKELINEAIEAVGVLNEEVYEQLEDEGEFFQPFRVITDGDGAIAQFFEIPLWNTDDDDRVFNDEKNEHDSLLPHLRMKVNEIVLLISKLKF